MGMQDKAEAWCGKDVYVFVLWWGAGRTLCDHSCVTALEVSS